MTAAGGLILLPALAQAQDGGELPAPQIAATEVQENGTVKVTLENGQTFVVAAAEATIGEDGVIVLSDAALQEIAAASAAMSGDAFAAAGIGEMGAAAGAGLLALAALAGGGGSGGGGGTSSGGTSSGGGSSGGGSSSSAMVTRTLKVIDAPLENALVFYDSDRDGQANQSEYLGLTGANGELDIEYTPVTGGSFIMVPAPIAQSVADGYGWSDAFTEQFDGVVTRDTVTDNIFDQVLSASDSGADGKDVVVSPVSNLLAAGVSEEVMREFLGLPEDIDLESFDFSASLASDDPAIQQAAQIMSTAAVALNSVIKAAVTAASASGTLTPEQLQQVAVKAAQDTATVIASLPAGTSAADAALIATSVATAGALNPDVDTGAMVEQIADFIEAADDAGAAEAAVANALDDLRASGALSSEQSNVIIATADAVGQSTQQVAEIFADLDIEEGQSIRDALDAAGLDEATDNGLAAVQDAVNEQLLGIRLAEDSNSAVEGQSAFIEGNVLANDFYTDGTDLPGETVLLSVNGSAVPTPEFDTEVSKDFSLSTSSSYRYSWYRDESGAWRYTRVGAQTESAENLMQAINFNGEMPSGYASDDFYQDLYDYYSDIYQRYYGNRFTDEEIDYYADRSATYVARYYEGRDYDPVDGSMVHQTVTVDAGTVLTFDYNFASYDYLPYGDYAFLAVQQVDEFGNPIGAGEILTGLDNNGLPALGDIEGKDGLFQGICVWRNVDGSFSYEFTEAGTYNIGIGTVDVGRNGAKAQLEVSDFAMLNGGTDVTPDGFEEDFEAVGNVTADAFAQTSETALFIQGYYGTLIISGEGDYVYQVGGINAEPIPDGEMVTDDFTYSVQLPDGSVASQNLSIEITGTEFGDINQSSVTIFAEDVLIEDEGALEVSGYVEGVPEAAEVVVIVTGAGASPVTETFAVTDGEFSGTLNVDGFDDGDLNVEVRVDGGLATTGEITVAKDTVVNSGPVTVEIIEEVDGIATFSVDGLSGDETLRIAFNDEIETVFVGVVQDGDNFTADLSGLDSGGVTTTLYITDDNGNVAVVDGPSIFRPELSLEIPVINSENVDDVTLSGSIDVPYDNWPVTVRVEDIEGTVLEFTQTVDFGSEFLFEGLDFSVFADGQLTATTSVILGGVEYSLETQSYLGVAFDPPVVTVLNGEDAPAFDIDGGELTLSITELEPGATGTVTLTDGDGNSVEVPVDAAGNVFADISGFTPGDELSISFEFTDADGNTVAGTADGVTVPVAVNLGTNTFYGDLQDAIDAAEPEAQLELAKGPIDGDVLIDKPLTLLGYQAGTPVGGIGSGRGADIGAESLDESVWATEETVLNGTVTIAAEQVTIDGMVFGSDTAPLVWDESLIDETTPGALDEFVLQNSILVGYDASGALTFNAGSGSPKGTYNGEPVADGWNISGNIIGGLYPDGSFNGALNLSGLQGATIAENILWRPTGAHMYVSSLRETDISDNYFYHGLHAGGADFDGMAEFFADGDGYGYGGSGYGYGGEGADGDTVYFGRNYWLELKGDNENVAITGNDGDFNSGGIQLFGETEGYVFNNITISGNTFEDFVNADPSGILGEGRAQSGFQGAILVSVEEGSSADGITIADNLIEIAYDQIFSERDNPVGIAVQGNVGNVDIEDNDISWVTSSSAEILAMLDDLDAPGSTYDGPVGGIILASGLSGQVNVTGNDITETLDAGTTAFGLYVLHSEEGGYFGVFEAGLNEAGNSYDITGNNVAEVFLDGFGTEFDWYATNFESELIYFSPGDEQLFYVVPGTNLADTINTVPSQTTLILPLSEDDDITLPDDAETIVLVDAVPDINGSDIVRNFTPGDSEVIDDADEIVIVGLDTSDLRGNGEVLQFVTSGDTVNDDAGMLIFTNETTDVEAAIEGLVGLNDGDAFYVVVDQGADADPTMHHVEMNGTDAEVSAAMIELAGISLGDLEADNFAPFSPEV
ncbi:VCBS domain-containing protein [Sagittula sp. SSi028]|uniref:VCBS domain-containing protein n=1 Tax=Sagittula sp. SSi028 TaxID=3400636 RepID=UPI003AF6F63E